MKSVGGIAIVVGVMILVVFVQVYESEAAITCSDVAKNLLPCVSYIVGGSGMPPSACCDGVKAVSSAAISNDDKKTACQCIKSNINGNAQSKLIKDLPANCGISLPFPLSADIDCSRIS